MGRDVTPKKPAGLATARTDSATFREAFAKDPATTLKEKGIILSAAEEKRLDARLGELRGPRGVANAAEVEVEVKVGIKF